MKSKKQVIKIIENTDIKLSAWEQSGLNLKKVRDLMIYEGYKLGYKDGRKKRKNE